MEWHGRAARWRRADILIRPALLLGYGIVVGTGMAVTRKHPVEPLVDNGRTGKSYQFQ